MAYSGTTAASSAQFPPVVLAAAMGGGRSGSTTTPVGSKLWLFSTTDTSTGPFVAGYFSAFWVGILIAGLMGLKPR